MLRLYHWYKVRGPPQSYSARFYSGSCVWGEANLASFLELVEHRAAHLQCPTKDFELAGVSHANCRHGLHNTFVVGLKGREIRHFGLGPWGLSSYHVPGVSSLTLFQ